MTLLEKLELDLKCDWQRLQLELKPDLKALALKAYYLKLALYKKAKIWSRALHVNKNT